MRETRRNMISGTFFLIVSVLYFSGTFSFVEISRHSQESKLLPRVYAAMLFLAALRILTKSAAIWLRERKERAAPAGEALPAGQSPNYIKVAATLVLIAVYAFLFQRIGFISATFVYLVAHMAVLAGKISGKIPKILVVSALTSLCLYYLFVRVFQIAFPYGSLF